MSQLIESILVPTDGSEMAEVGAQHGIDIATTTGADPHILSVVDTREIESSSVKENSRARIEGGV